MEKCTIENLIQQGLSQRLIAKSLCIGHSTLVYWLKQYGLQTIGRTRPKILCQNCGKATSTRNRKYCNNRCQADAEWKSCKEKIESTGVADSDRTAKKYLIQQCGHKCSMCDLSEWRGEQLPLILDHINGNPYDNRIENLRLVCSNCDSILPTYKAKNKGHGRHERRNRYKEGKSY